MLVPLELTYRSAVIWSNPVSSSTRFCRPIKHLYESENSELVRAQQSRVESHVKELNRTVVKFVRDQDEYELGIQHNLRLTMIDSRCFECILHISYRLPIKSWQIRGQEAKKLCNARNHHTQSRFIKALGLLVDFSKDSGSDKIKIIYYNYINYK